MKKMIVFLIVVAAIGAGVYFFYDHKPLVNIQDLDKLTKGSIPKIKSKQEKKEVLPLLDGDLYTLIGESDDTLVDQLGKPDRKDVSAYEYTWWIYTDEATEYLQFGMEDGEVVTVFATGEDVSADPLVIGDSYEDIRDNFDFEDEVVYHDGLSFYKFLLSEDNMKKNPLVKIADDVFVELYFDTFADELSSIRILTGETLLKQRIYEMEYRGSLPDKPDFSEDKWKEIEKGMERQIFALTNVYRHRFDVAALQQDEQVQHVAYLHSKDMSENNYFSHYAKDGSGLKERLQAENIYYMTAGENIAAQHTDGPAAMEGWLNSEGHREALLNDEYTHLGVGVHHFYYTQNFLFKP